MGDYLNPDNVKFYNSVNHSKIYVDKTMLIAETNSVLLGEQKNICISRPRRFGKSMAANMLAAYYSKGCDSRELFSKLKISQHPDFEKHLNKYNVIHIDISKYIRKAENVKGLISSFSQNILMEMKDFFCDVKCSDWSDLITSLKAVYGSEKKPFIFIIDEWDCIFREWNKPDEQKEYLDFLHDLLKDENYVGLTYMTGILPIKKYGKHSALNMFREFSMTNQKKLAEFTGFTDEEVLELCEKYDIPYDEMKRWYDGYIINGISIYNPKSVVESVTDGIFDNYWTQTETYYALDDYIRMNFDGLKDKIIKMIAGESVKINHLKFQNDMFTFKSSDDVLTLLVHLGYLTFDFDTKMVSIPNSEVQQEFINSIEDGGWENVMDAIRKSDDLLKSTLAMDEKTVAEYVEEAHRENTSILKYNDENSLSCVLSLAYYSARNNYVIYRELAGGNGYADLVFVPRKECSTPAFIVELKWDKSAETAITQIKQKKYTECLKDYSGEILLVGINYDKEDKIHTCQIEKVVK